MARVVSLRTKTVPVSVEAQPFKTRADAVWMPNETVLAFVMVMQPLIAPVSVTGTLWSTVLVNVVAMPQMMTVVAVWMPIEIAKGCAMAQRLRTQAAAAPMTSVIVRVSATAHLWKMRAATATPMPTTTVNVSTMTIARATSSVTTERASIPTRAMMARIVSPVQAVWITNARPAHKMPSIARPSVTVKRCPRCPMAVRCLIVIAMPV